MQELSRAYIYAATFDKKLYGMDQLIMQSDITLAHYEYLFPLIVWNASKQCQRMK